MSGFRILLGRELRLVMRQGADSFMVVMFFVLAVILFPLGVGPEPAMLATISAGVIWVAALLAAMLSLERLFHADYEDGGLDLLALSPAPLEILVLAKVAGHWLSTGLPLIIVSPLLALLMNMDGAGMGVLLLALALGTPAMSLIGAIGAALAIGARRGGVLLSLLVLPLFIPTLIFGVGAIDAVLTGLSPRPHLLILGALSLGALALCPWAAAAAVRQSLE